MKKEFEKEQNDNQIDDAFLDMPDMEDDEKFRQWLEEEYLKEADAIEESLFDGRKFEDNQDIVEKLSVSRESFYQRAREEGLLEDTADEKAEDEKNTEEAVPESTEKKILEFRKNAGVSKNPAHDANRKYLIKNIRYLAGDDTKIVVDNDNNNDQSNLDEDVAIQDIEEKLDIKLPVFCYRPYDMKYLNYEINNITYYAKIEYEYKGNFLVFYIDKQDNGETSNVRSINGDGKFICNISKEDGIKISIKRMEDGEENMSTYMANWKENDTTYYLSGKIELDELKKIVKEMKF